MSKCWNMEGFHLLLQEAPACPEGMEAPHLGFLVLLHELNFTRNGRSWGL
jgi:hypothetical protein